MVSITCKNKRITTGETLVECGRFLGAMSDDLAKAIATLPSLSVYFRCPQCGANHKFVKVYGDNGLLTQETMTDTRIDGRDAVDSVIMAQQLY